MSTHTEQARQLLEGARGHQGPQQVLAACLCLTNAIEVLEAQVNTAISLFGTHRHDPTAQDRENWRTEIREAKRTKGPKEFREWLYRRLNEVGQ